MSKVRLAQVSKHFDDVVAVNNLSLEIQQGAFVSLLGPSGCGKTTTLRMLAGFEFPESGAIYFDDRDVTYMKANMRNTGMVFQNFALFPHMTVYENIAFGLQARKMVKSVVDEKVREALALVNMDGLGKRGVAEISGGQQQRVALARAIVIEPNILLLDEPLSNLDAKLREEMRVELRALQQRLGITTIYVTHDQEEALALSDHIAVMNHGVCQQYASAEQIYYKPANAFVAGFVGNSNILDGLVVDNGSEKAIKISENWIISGCSEINGYEAGKHISIGLRPEGIAVSDAGQSGVTATVKQMRLSGSLAEYEIIVDEITVRTRSLATAADFHRKPGMPVTIATQASHLVLLPGE